MVVAHGDDPVRNVQPRQCGGILRLQGRARQTVLFYHVYYTIGYLLHSEIRCQVCVVIFVLVVIFVAGFRPGRATWPVLGPTTTSRSSPPTGIFQPSLLHDLVVPVILICLVAVVAIFVQ